ncbi:MAG: methyltransferase domain-containing protein [Candidatus Hydrogenedentes bacterium]|nr:methyltransferase domain-containing protein [Candidatus Hydrogenedentota bacterium]
MAAETPDLILEVGSGLSPIVTDRDRIVYSDLAYEGVSQLRRIHGRGHYVVADCTMLPFRDNAFSHAVCSEVLEHVENDGDALVELSRVLDAEGQLYLTFPHGRLYFWNDDRFAGHFRRYNLDDMLNKLTAGGLRPLEIRKVLGPLEKLTMSACVFAIDASRLFSTTRNGASSPPGRPPSRLVVAAFKWSNAVHGALCTLDAKVFPRAMAAVLFIRARHTRM